MPELPSPLIDILSAESFAVEHLPGSVNICVYETAFIDKIRAAFPDPNTALTVYGLNDIEDAVNNAITRAGNTIRNMKWFEVAEVRGHLENNKVAYWQATVKIGFTLDT